MLRNDPEKLLNYLKKENFDLQSLDSKGNTLLYFALEKKSFECAAILVSQGAELSKSEKLVYKNLISKIEHQQIIRFSIKYFSRTKDAIINYFLSRSKFIGNRSREFLNNDKIKEYFEKLFSISDLSEKYIIPILEIIEYSSIKVNIIFDLKSESVENIDLSAGSGTKGRVLLNSGTIYIGAKRPDNQVQGALIHELCHLAMQIIYDNYSDPFPKSCLAKDDGITFANVDQMRREEKNKLERNLSLTYPMHTSLLC